MLAKRACTRRLHHLEPRRKTCPLCGTRTSGRGGLHCGIIQEQPEVRHGGVSHMHFDKFSFGSIQIDGKTYEKDVVIDRGEIRRRKKGPSKKFREDFGHTPLSIEEKLPWNCRQLVIGTGAYGNLPVMEEVAREAERRR